MTRSLTDAERDTAFCLGCYASCEGLSYNANPFERSSEYELWSQWVQGWLIQEGEKVLKDSVLPEWGRWLLQVPGLGIILVGGNDNVRKDM